MEDESKERRSVQIEPASTDEGRIAQIASLAYDKVEERIRNGNASAMELVYFLKLGSEKAKLEQQELESKTRLQEAKIKAMEAAETDKVFYQKVLDAMKSYRVDDGGDYE